MRAKDEVRSPKAEVAAVRRWTANGRGLLPVFFAERHRDAEGVGWESRKPDSLPGGCGDPPRIDRISRVEFRFDHRRAGVKPDG